MAFIILFKKFDICLKTSTSNLDQPSGGLIKHFKEKERQKLKICLRFAKFFLVEPDPASHFGPDFTQKRPAPQH